ncbi:MAG: 3-oxoacyl-ACP reductase FabG [Janthinobacterium lividum]
MTQRRALVTGGAAGIGASIAQRLKAAGHDVVVIDIAPDRIAAFTERTGIPGLACDVSSYEDVAAIVAKSEQDGPFDIVVNNAGITRDAMIHKMTETQWSQLIAVNLTSVFNTTRCLSPGMRSRGWGRIITISSMTGQKGNIGQANYAAAKAGVIGFTKTIALELAGRGVTANCIAPGFIMTDMTAAMPAEILEAERNKIPAGRIGLPEDIAAAAAYLASEDASFVTGQVLAVNGGQYM